MSEVCIDPKELVSFFLLRFVYVSDKESGVLTPSKTPIHYERGGNLSKPLV